MVIREIPSIFLFDKESDVLNSCRCVNFLWCIQLHTERKTWNEATDTTIPGEKLDIALSLNGKFILVRFGCDFTDGYVQSQLPPYVCFCMSRCRLSSGTKSTPPR